jgi:hypothetical protein
MAIDREEAAMILDACSKALTGHSSELQGAVLADLLAMWLAGHQCWGDAKATFKLREELLNAHIKEVVRQLPINERILMEKYAKAHANQTKN